VDKIRIQPGVKTAQGLQIQVRVQYCNSISLTETLMCPSKQWSGSMTRHVPEANDPDIAVILERSENEKRQNNAGRWINPEYGYAKTNPNGNP
jgi:hypothetical protein